MPTGRLDRASAVPEARERTLLHRIYAFVEQQLADPGLYRPVAAIGAHWGFLSAAHFSRAFRDEYGVPPAEFRTRSAMLTRDET